MIDTNGDSNLFVGRDQEQETFCSLLEDVKGKVILVAGSASMGKSMLLKKMMQLAEHQSAIQCTCVSYQITPTDGIDSLMLEIIGDVADVAVSYAGEIKRLANQNKQKLSALFSAVGVIPAVGKTLEALGKLLLSLAEEARQSGNARQKLRQILEILSGRLPAQGRFIVFIDPEKLMPDNSADVWRLVLDNLPEKILFVFAQRPEDVLIGNSDFTRMGNVYRVPADVLEKFSSQEVDELIELRKRQISTGITDKQIRECLERYDGHPFSVQAAMSLLTEGVRPNELPDRPEPSKFAQTIIKTIEQKRDIDALSFLEAAAIIEIPRSKEIIAEVAGLSEKQGRIVLADRFMGGLFRKEVKGYRIYHIILADEVLKRISEKTRKEYHCRTAGVYRRALAEAERSESYPDETSLERLPVHVKVGEGEAAFVACFVNECQSLLRRLGLLDLHIKFSEQCLEIVEGDSVEQAAMLTNLGLVYQTRGEFDKAEGMYQKSLAISEQLGRKDGMAIQYGNLGNIYRFRGELDKAEEMCRKSLMINEQLGHKREIAIVYGCIGSAGIGQIAFPVK